MRSGFGALAGRVAAIIGGLLGVGIVLRLIVAILQPVLPSGLMQSINAGWGMLYSIVSPALPPIIAVGILGAIWWVIASRHR